MVIRLHYDDGATVTYDNSCEALTAIVKLYNNLKSFPTRLGRRFTVEMFCDLPQDETLPF